MAIDGRETTAHSPAGTFPPHNRWRWALGWAGRVAEFGAVQCVVQVLAGAAGILVVRTMTKQDYALFAITNQMQTAGNLLADLGIGIGVRSIGGRVWQDRQRFGELLTTALGLRRRLATLSLAVVLPVALWMLRSNGADWSTAAVLCGVLVASVVPLLASSVHVVVPQLHGEYRRIQRLDLGNAALRLAMIGTLAATRMTVVLAAAVGAIANWVQLRWLRRWSRDHANPAAPPNADYHREVVRLSMQMFPNTLFFCFQGQVTLLILTLVGNTTGIADLTALGRLAMLLTAFSAVFTNVLVPRFARCQDPYHLTRLYAGLVGAAVLALLPVVLAGWLYPTPLLWLLGEQYAGLEIACGWVVTTACLAVVSSVVWQMNSSKAWIRYSSKLWIPATLSIQAILAFFLNLREFNNVIIFSFISTCIPLPLFALDLANGMASARVKRSRFLE